MKTGLCMHCSYSERARKEAEKKEEGAVREKEERRGRKKRKKGKGTRRRARTAGRGLREMRTLPRGARQFTPQQYVNLDQSRMSIPRAHTCPAPSPTGPQPQRPRPPKSTSQTGQRPCSLPSPPANSSSRPPRASAMPLPRKLMSRRSSPTFPPPIRFPP